MAADDAPDCEQVELKVADMIGAMMEFWGFKRPMGRMWTLLFLSPEPLHAAEIGERLTMSAGAVSMTLAELIKWGAARKTWRPGERRDYYEAETSIWKMVTRVLRERELALVRDAAEAFELAQRTFREAAQRAAPAQRERLQFMADRVSALLSLARAGEALLRAIVAGQAVDPTPIRQASSQG